MTRRKAGFTDGLRRGRITLVSCPLHREIGSHANTSTLGAWPRPLTHQHVGGPQPVAEVPLAVLSSENQHFQRILRPPTAPRPACRSRVRYFGIIAPQAIIEK
jgi:hypothetical protein